jgi:hypothetical protein
LTAVTKKRRILWINVGLSWKISEVSLVEKAGTVLNLFEIEGTIPSPNLKPFFSEKETSSYK